MPERRSLVLLVVVGVACSRKPPPPPPPAPPGDAAAVVKPDLPTVAPIYRNPANDSVEPAVAGSGKTFMVVSESALASQVGKDVLAGGGNAVDAAVAVSFALAVVHPTAGNIGGGGFAVVRTGPGKSLALDFRETAPAAATADMYLDADGKPTDASVVGHRAAGVPGSVAGMWALHKKLGKRPWADLLKPAIAYARDGFAIDPILAASLARESMKKRLLKFATSAKQWFVNGEPVTAGTKVTLPELAATLDRIATGGSDGFYKGETAKLVVEEMARGGGIMTAADLAAYVPVWREPLHFNYRGHAFTSMPPPSSGGIVLAMTAGMFGGVDLSKVEWHGFEHVHRLAEVWKRAFAARNELLGDPKFVKTMPIAKLLSPAYQAELAASIGSEATPSKDVQALREGDHTTNFCVVDATGMAVVITTTLNTAFGSGVTVDKAGFLLNNEMDDFTAKPGSPNVFGLVQGVANKIEPGKRMLSSMSPTIVEDAKGNVVMLVGAAGGPRIITEVWQAISNVLDYGQTAAAAIANPRVHHQHLPDILFLEAGAIDLPTETALRTAKHELKWSHERREFGAANAIVRTAAGWDGAADPRGGGAAIGD